MEILPFLLKICAGIVVALLFGLAVFIHEFGHFLAARLLGLRVDVFSIGFGPAIWKWRRNGIEYRICWIPLGGYVALPQLDPEGMDKIQGGPAEAADAAPLPPIAPWRRIVVAFAGPFGNAVLAVALAWILYAMPHAYTAGPDTFVGDVVAGSPAAEAGFRPDDRILAVNGAPVAGWNDFAVECHLSGDVTNGVVVRVARDGRELDLPVPVAKDPESGILRIQGLSRKVACLVGQVGEASPAAGAGILPGDRIVACNGAVLGSPAHMIQCISAAGETPVTLAILRGGKTLSLTLTPRHEPRAGPPADRHRVRRDGLRPPFAVAAVPAARWRQLRATTPEGRGARAARPAWRRAQKARPAAPPAAWAAPGDRRAALAPGDGRGSNVALAFLRFLCVNLALILNLLPLPVLDGGHILFALWELVTRRKPGAKFVALLTNAFAILLIGLMLLLVFRDVLSLSRLFRPRAPSAATATSAIEAEAGEAR
jgi:regulator of sigma E protease